MIRTKKRENNENYISTIFCLTSHPKKGVGKNIMSACGKRENFTPPHII